MEVGILIFFLALLGCYLVVDTGINFFGISLRIIESL